MSRLTTFTGEKLLFALPNGESLVKVNAPHSYKLAGMLVAVTSDGFRTDYPILYSPGKIGLDNPEYFSEEFILRIKAFSLSKDAENFLCK